MELDSISSKPMENEKQVFRKPISGLPMEKAVV